MAQVYLWRSVLPTVRRFQGVKIPKHSYCDKMSWTHETATYGEESMKWEVAIFLQLLKGDLIIWLQIAYCRSSVIDLPQLWIFSLNPLPLNCRRKRFPPEPKFQTNACMTGPFFLQFFHKNFERPCDFQCSISLYAQPGFRAKNLSTFPKVQQAKSGSSNVVHYSKKRSVRVIWSRCAQSGYDFPERQ